MANLFIRTMKNLFSRPYSYNLLPYVLIGGGTASYYASMTIRARDPKAKVLIISDEEESPYRRGPLSKELWWYADEKSQSTLSYTSPATKKRRYITYEADGFYLDPDELDNWEHGGVALLCGAKVEKVDANANFVQLEDGRKIGFEKCLIATGSIPLHKKMLEKHPEFSEIISYIGNITDYRKLHKKLTFMDSDSAKASTSGESKKVIIIGGGLLATELAYSLNRRYSRGRSKTNMKIIQITHNERGILDEILPSELSEYSAKILRSQGVELYLNTNIQSLKSKNGEIELKLSSSNKIEDLRADHLIIAIGSEPSIQMVQKSGFFLDEKNGGVKTNAQMHVKNNVWAAGDICSFFDEMLGYQRRCTHWLHAQITGRVAGENMTNGNKKYIHQIRAFITMLGPTAHICGIGDTDPKKFNTTSIYAADENKTSENDEFRALVLYTDRETDDINGVLLYNIHGFGEEIARKLINDRKKLKNSLKECAKLFELWEIEEHNEKGIEKENSKLITENEIEAYQMRED